MVNFYIYYNIYIYIDTYIHKYKYIYIYIFIYLFINIKNSDKPETVHRYWSVSEIYRTGGQTGTASGTVLTSLHLRPQNVLGWSCTPCYKFQPIMVRKIDDLLKHIIGSFLPNLIGLKKIFILRKSSMKKRHAPVFSSLISLVY